jgi:hypothetical protein
MDLGSDACERPECVSARKIVKAAQEYCHHHGHTTRLGVALEDALIEAGLLNPEQYAWRKKK